MSRPRPRWSTRSSAPPNILRDGGRTRRSSRRSPAPRGLVVFGDRSAPGAKVVSPTVMEADPRRFSFRWAHDQDQAATSANSLLVTFDLLPTGTGTLLRFTEAGFRERGFEGAVLGEQYYEHARGWHHFLPRLGAYVAQLVSTP
jgi:uncharacterized protein YndB with AHSA1/START domain